MIRRSVLYSVTSKKSDQPALLPNQIESVDRVCLVRVIDNMQEQREIRTIFFSYLAILTYVVGTP